MLLFLAFNAYSAVAQIAKTWDRRDIDQQLSRGIDVWYRSKFFCYLGFAFVTWSRLFVVSLELTLGVLDWLTKYSYRPLTFTPVFILLSFLDIRNFTNIDSGWVHYNRSFSISGLVKYISISSIDCYPFRYHYLISCVVFVAEMHEIIPELRIAGNLW